MKRLTLIFLLLSTYTFAQKSEILRMDSLPAEGVLLNKGWKFYAGDDPDFAKADFDDRKWQSITLSDFNTYIPQLKNKNIGWFRANFSMDSTLLKNQLAIQFSQLGASEIYLNGKLFQQFGYIKSSSNVESFNPGNKPFLLPANSGTKIHIAIRFASHIPSRTWLFTSATTKKLPLSITINTWNNALTHYKIILEGSGLQPVSYMFSVLSFLFLLLFAFYPKEKVNLFFGLFCFFLVINAILSVQLSEGSLDISKFGLLSFYSDFTGVVLGTLMLSTISQIVLNRITPYLLILFFGLWIDYPAFYFFGPVYPVFALDLILRIVITFSFFYFSREAFRQRNYTIGIVALNSGIINIIAILILYGSLNLNAYYLLSVFIMNFILITFYVSTNFARKSKHLEVQLGEIKNLSEDNLKKEQEKQQILAAQNETLEQQVTERTAELSTKNRELEIESALERVRSRSMAMQKSEELKEVVLTVFNQLKELGFVLDAGAATILIFSNDSKKHFQQWIADRWQSYAHPYKVDYTEHSLSSDIFKAKESGIDFFSKLYPKDEKNAYFKYLFEESEYFKQVPEEVKNMIFESEHYGFSIAYGKQYTAMLIPTNTGKLLTKDQQEILKRFAAVFEQAYTRFLDLQKAEEQAREAQIEVALERVRSRTMAMQKSEHLVDVINVVAEQLLQLNFQLNTASFFLNNESEDFTFWLAAIGESNPEKIVIPKLSHPALNNIKEAQKNGVDFWADDLSFEEKNTWFQHVFAHSPGRVPEHRQKFILNTKGYARSVVLMKQIGLFIVNYVPQAYTDAENAIFKRFAAVFEQAYTRFLDLQKAEAQAEQARLNLIQIQTEKKRAEDALTILKATQNQLIQSEKLASLGELTAGIAHEIQNPLNFVNNFAEVSAEMLDDMEEELDKGDTSEAKALAADLKNNLKKINHHGQRASSIVKGMLEHSRASTGVKELTDINALADEFLRLAYHGLRAKDNSFNATMETHFDPDLPRVEVIPQDIGRVLLNLINNAFYAVNEKAKQGIDGYSPVVTLSTRLRLTSAELSNRRSATERVIEISVKDNGNGIPDAIKDKIFQPFFTTKPTGQGTGLGLSLAYDIVVKGHGGTLEVSSVPNEGTEFVIRLV